MKSLNIDVNNKTPPPIQLKDVSFYYENGTKRKQILNNVNWIVNQGDFNIIFGPSGSGKTTLLYLLGGLEFPKSGKIFLFNNEILNSGSFKQFELRKKIGYVFQNIYLPDSFKVKEYLEFNANLYEIPVKTIKQKIKETAKELRIDHLLDKRTIKLSGGEKKCVALASIYICKNPLILLDEPTGSIDYHTKNIFWKSIKKLNDFGLTIVAVTHDKETFKYAKKIFRLKNGNLKEI
ncbi:MAG: energy-coupling factor ABC transporter ATP-binding protein [Candidatus Lokiarchaeota archaeon]|nr:energy-coupling factor ABC transporter ATP-binding protein [Candidatus Harpocratesius repetitus]